MIRNQAVRAIRRWYKARSAPRTRIRWLERDASLAHREQLPILRQLGRKIQERRRRDMLKLEGTGWDTDLDELRAEQTPEEL